MAASVVPGSRKIKRKGGGCLTIDDGIYFN
jgi:hypothetical protein